MKNVFFFIALMAGVGVFAQPGNPNASGVITPGPPFTATGISTGGGEMTLQLDYIYDAVLANDVDIALKVALEDSTGADAPGTYVTGHDNIAALALKANLNSPTITGTLTAATISQTATVIEKTVLVTLDSTKLAGSTAGRLGHIDGAILVAAPGADSLLEFVSALLIYDFGTAAYTGGADDVVIQIGGSGTQVALSGAITGANLLEAAGDKVLRLGSTATELVPVVNKALSIAGTTLINGGTATGQLRVHLTYRIHILGL